MNNGWISIFSFSEKVGKHNTNYSCDLGIFWAMAHDDTTITASAEIIQTYRLHRPLSPFSPIHRDTHLGNEWIQNKWDTICPWSLRTFVYFPSYPTIPTSHQSMLSPAIAFVPPRWLHLFHSAHISGGLLQQPHRLQLFQALSMTSTADSLDLHLAVGFSVADSMVAHSSNTNGAQSGASLSHFGTVSKRWLAGLYSSPCLVRFICQKKHEINR